MTDLFGGCLRQVLLWCVQWFRRSSLLARRTDRFVFSKIRISPGVFWRHIKPKVPPNMDYMKHATTSDYDDHKIPDLSGGCLRHVLLWCVQ